MKKVLGFVLAFSLCVSSFASDFTSAQVKELSDRNYYQTTTNLINNAKESIVVSMYVISLGRGDNPVKFLLNDLLKARARGVGVTLYLNVQFRPTEKQGQVFIESDAFKQLQLAGCIIHFMPKPRRLHDKLIIIDQRFVIVGSTNWSTAAINNNFESNTLIDSKSHAKAKLARLKKVLNFIQSNSPITETPLYLTDLPKTLILDKALIEAKGYFPTMVRKKDDRAFDMYLLFLAHSQKNNKQEFFINLEDLAISLSMDKSYEYSALRRQMIKALKRLQNNYKLIEVDFNHGQDALVKLVKISQDTVSILTTSVVNQNPKIALRLKYLLLIEALLKTQGEDLFAITKTDLAKRFHISKMTIHAAFNDFNKTFVLE